MAKFGLVVEGGGMKCAYNAGILDAFMDNRITFDYCIGVSGGAGNVASYLAGQRGRNIRFYTTYIHEPGYFGLKSFVKTGNLFGLQYIYGDLTNSTGKDPLDFQAILKNPAEYRVVATNALTGMPEYFVKEDMEQDDYRCIMASCAIPVVCKPIKIRDFYYYDGGLTDAIPIEKALEDGCDKIVVITSKPRDYVRKHQSMRFLYSKICRNYPNIVSAIDNRHGVYNEKLKKVHELEMKGTAFVFAPSEHLKVGTYTMDEQIEEKMYEIGMKDFSERNNELEYFLNEKSKTQNIKIYRK